jgi:hypothetical protein
MIRTAIKSQRRGRTRCSPFRQQSLLTPEAVDAVLVEDVVGDVALLLRELLVMLLPRLQLVQRRLLLPTLLPQPVVVDAAVEVAVAAEVLTLLHLPPLS